MSAILIKSRARKPLEIGKVNAGWYPWDGEIAHIGPCVCLTIGEHRLFIPKNDWYELVKTQDELMRKNPVTA